MLTMQGGKREFTRWNFLTYFGVFSLMKIVRKLCVLCVPLSQQEYALQLILRTTAHIFSNTDFKYVLCKIK